MARKKYIEDEDLIALINKYYIENGQQPRILKLPLITEFIKSHGYPNYQVESLRRNEVARQYVENLKEDTSDHNISMIVAHKSLDVEAFLAKNASRSKLISALTALDQYYQTICDSTIDLQKELASCKRKLERLQEKLDSIEKEQKDFSDERIALKKENKQLKEQCSAYKTFIEDYVYPEISNELLRKDGVLKSEKSTTVTEKAMDDNVITARTTLKEKDPPVTESISKKQNATFSSNVIEGLFNSLK